MIMHASRLVAAPGHAARGRLELARGLDVEEPAGTEPLGARRQQPRPGVVVERRIEEDHVEVAPLARDERTRVADRGLEALAPSIAAVARSASTNSRFRSTAIARAAPRDTASSVSAPLPA